MLFSICVWGPKCSSYDGYDFKENDPKKGEKNHFG